MIISQSMWGTAWDWLETNRRRESIPFSLLVVSPAIHFRVCYVVDRLAALSDSSNSLAIFFRISSEAFESSQIGCTHLEEKDSVEQAPEYV